MSADIKSILNERYKDLTIKGYDSGDGYPRILFLGNSFTWHPVKSEIGWEHAWGMAASTEENDYVHVFMKKVREKYPEASYRIGWLVDWERNFRENESILCYFDELVEWKPDYIFSFILGANTPADTLKEHDFTDSYRRMLRYMDPEKRAKFYVTTNFWPDEAKDSCVREAVRAEGLTLIEAGDLGKDDSNMAIGEYWHEGVARHAGDKGMRAIAERLISESGILE